MASRERTALTWSVRIALLAALAMVVAWLLLHRLSQNASPRWTEVDLPALPPDADNGWVTIARKPRADDWRPVALETVRAVYEHPRLVDACPARPGALCNDRAIDEAFAVIMISGYDMRRRGDLGEAYALSRLLLSRHLDYARSARRVRSAEIACWALDSVLAEIAELEALSVDAGSLDDATRAARADIRALVRALADGGGIDPRNVVVYEYLVARESIDVLLADHPSTRWVLDRHATALALDDHFGRLYDYAAGVRATMPPEENLTTTWHFRLHNPAGKRHLTWLSWYPPDLPGLREKQQATHRRAVALLDSLRTGL